MNYTRIAIAALVAFVVDSLYGFLVWGMALSGEFGRYPEIYRSAADQTSYLPLMFAGTLIGLFIGYTFSFVAGSYHLIPLDPQVYAVPYVPFHSNIFDGVWITTVAMGISSAATILPARAAVRLLPVEILRYE